MNPNPIVRSDLNKTFIESVSEQYNIIDCRYCEDWSSQMKFAAIKYKFYSANFVCDDRFSQYLQLLKDTNDIFD